MRPLSEQVVVVTGASSGIGRCAALHLGRQGARIVAFARGGEALESLVRGIHDGGGEAIHVTGDVSNPDDIDRLAEAAVARYGRIDTWVNNASLFIQGAVVDIEPHEFRRLIEVNLLGAIYGSRRAALQMLGQSPPEGVVIQVSSIVGERGPAWFSPYAASKRGLVGFTESLRTELWETEVEVATLYLPSMDTPIYQHARGKFGTAPTPAPPVYDPTVAAEAIADLAVKPRARRHVGWFHWLYTAPDRLSPVLGDWFLHRTRGFTLGDDPAGPDNIDGPTSRLGGEIRGGWGRKGWRGFTWGNLVRHVPREPFLVAAAAGVVGVVGAFAAKKLL